MENRKWASAQPTMTMMFSVMCMIYWAWMIGILKPEAQLFIGIIQLALYPSYIIAAIIELKGGDGLSGNVYYYFATFFGAASGAVNIVSYFAGIFGWPVDPSVMGFIWIWIGVMLAGILPAYRKYGWIFFTLCAFAAISLLVLALVAFGIGPAAFMPILNQISAWCLFLVGIEGLYLALAAHLETADIKIPTGKSLFK